MPLYIFINTFYDSDSLFIFSTEENFIYLVIELDYSNLAGIWASNK